MKTHGRRLFARAAPHTEGGSVDSVAEIVLMNFPCLRSARRDV